MLFPFFPLNPHLFARPPSSPSAKLLEDLFFPLDFPDSSRGVAGLELCKLGFMGLELPPRIAETEECAHRACLRIADVTVIHSVVIRATGSTATEVEGLLEDFMAPLYRGTRSMCWLVSRLGGVSVWCMEEAGEFICPLAACEFMARASLLMMFLLAGAAWVQLATPGFRCAALWYSGVEK